MAGGDEPRGRDLDDWFDEPQPPRARRARPSTPAPDADVAERAHDDDWLGGRGQPGRGPRRGAPGGLSNPRLAIAAVVALVVLLVIGLAVAGVFGSSTPRRAATTVLTTHARTTTAATTATPPPSSVTAAPSGPLKLGDSGAQVKVLQRALASLGYSPGAIDGNYGPSTQQAVARFQAAAKLTPDGILGPQTLQALKNALAGP
jgi:hypothetical protein